jgi:hypothetical protein
MFPVTSVFVVAVVMLKVAEVDPAGMVTEAGTVASALAELRATGYPPVGAAALIVIVPTEVDRPVREAGFNVRLVGSGPVIVRVAFAD